MTNIDNLEPANKADVVVYMPYYAKDKHSVLPYAITLYREGSLEGRRHIENGTGIPFVASWYVSKLPSELTRCRLQFEGQADFSYEITISNSEFIDHLIDSIKTFKQLGAADFSQGFYRKLLRFDE
ncbi:type IV pilus biogenesis protein EbsA [Pannus brasiliensis CCIBt3594]|uniref:Type IV pilus biogenesis protein EbsA n=1 Tax=Pannus brasiliensis CCIBt3594 TaxID=1427578 RepID=A0AAW9QWX5_9CHRO